MIRSLSRGLEIIILLNRRDSASAGELARELDIPRATVYRILETLCTKDLIRQDESDQRFRITPRVRTLSAGFTDEDHMAHISRRYLKRVTDRLNWPVALATISGVDLIVRENTDQMSPLAIEKFTSGYRMSILQTASGLCILANMSVRRRRIILDTLEKMNRKEDQLARQRESLKRRMREIRRRGFAVHQRPRRYSALTAMAVPIVPIGDHVRGAVTIRYASRSIRMEAAVESFVPILNEAADGIARRIQLHLENRAQHPGLKLD